ncbi:tryptophan-rich sensory protein [Candidatus Saccharibacteria bacterium]|nr:tryptophan-rich sensory protein [Candidatus Saccharibacteria bacterium]
MRRIDPAKLIASLAVAFSAAAIGSLATIPNIPTWYEALEKPFFSPPNWVFGPVWTLLYTLIGISLYLVWSAKTKHSKRNAYLAFGIQLALNALWSLVFFGLQQPWLGVGVIIALLVMIILTMREFWPIRRYAAYLLVPYLLWVCFATCLNIAVALLN